MSSLATCLRKAGKAISNDDATAIRDIYDEYLQGGMPQAEAAQKAIDEYLGELREEREGLIDMAAEKGGDVSKFRGANIRLAQPDKNAELAGQLSVIDHLYGQKVPLPGLDKKKNNTRTFAKYLSKRVRRLNRGKPLSAMTPRNKDVISEVMYLETVAAMQQTGHAGTWYSDTLKEAVAVAGLLHPEINVDPVARSAFLFTVAVTSNGATVGDNTVHAEEVYSLYKKHGKMPNKGYGDVANAMKKAFKLYNELEAKWGKDVLTDFMHTEFTVGELKLLGLEVSGENVDTAVYGSAVFGPKIGQGFYQNLSGNYTPLTMDRWWMRTWGRMAGNLAPEGMAAATLQAEKLRAILPDHQAQIEGMGYTVDELLESDKKLLAFAGRIHREYARGGFKDKTEINKKAKNFDLAYHDPVVAPRNGTERAWIREVAADARRKLNERGYNVDTASMQALLWYPEKQFYLENGVGNERAKPTDYSQEFQKLAAARGIDQSRIATAVAGARAGQSAGAAGRRGAKPGKPSKSTRALAAEARQRLIHEAAFKELREFDKAAYPGRAPKGSQRVVEGAIVNAVHKPAVKIKNSFEKAGLGVPEFLGLSISQESAQVFFTNAKDAKPSKTQLYKPEEYELARTFMTEDGLAGFALMDDQITTIFKNKKSEHKGLSQTMIKLAVEQGGRWLRTDNDMFGHMFAEQGMRPVAVLGDEVFMVYDRTLVQPYSRDNATVVKTRAEALNIVRDTIHELEPRNYPERSLRLRLEEEPSPIVDIDPTNPLSQITKIAATVEDQSVNGPASATSLRQSIIDAGYGKNAGHLEAVLAVIPRRNLRDFVSRTAMPSVGEYVRTANRMDGERNRQMSEHEKVGKRWSNYISKNKAGARLMGEMMHAATLAGVDPSIPYKSLKPREKMNDADKAADAKRRGDHQILKRWWAKLDPEAQAIYKEVRDGYIRQREEIEASLMSRIAASQADRKAKVKIMAALQKKFEAGRVAGPYFPLARFGELWAAAKDADGKTVAFSRFEKVSDQREWVRNFRQAGYAVDSGKRQDDLAIVTKLDPAFVAKVTTAAGKLDVGLADEIWQLYLKALPEMSMRKAFIHRKNRLGFTTDAIRAFGHNMFHGAHQVAKLKYMHQMETQLERMKEESRILEQQEDPEALWSNAVYREMVKRHEWARNPRASAWATKATSLGFAWYLGATPAAAAVNLTQTAIVGLPVLAAKFGWAKSSAHLAKAAALWASSWGPTENRLRGDEQRAMKEAHEIGLFEKTMAHDLAGVGEAGMEYGGTMYKAMQVVSYLFHKAEQANREITFLASYRLAREKGLSHNDAIMMGEDLTWDAHFDYNNVNRPRVMQNDFAKVVLLFRQYSLNMTYRLVRDAKESLKGESPQVKKEARTRFAGMLAQTFIFAGASGMPLFWMAEMIMNALFSDEDDPYDFKDDTRAYLAQQYSPAVADIIMKGAMDKLTGATLSTRVSLNNLWIREAPANLEGSDWWLHMIGELSGPVFNLGAMAATAVQRTSEGMYERAIEQVLPKAIKDGAKSMRYLQEGVQNLRGDQVVGKDELSSWDLFMQAVGFTPARISNQYEQNRAVKEAEAKLLKRKGSLMDRLFLASRTGDKQMLAETMQAIGRFNKKNPALAIDTSGVISSARSRAEYSQWSRGGVTVNKRLQYLHAKKRFLENQGEK